VCESMVEIFLEQSTQNFRYKHFWVNTEKKLETAVRERNLLLKRHNYCSVYNLSHDECFNICFS